MMRLLLIALTTLLVSQASAQPSINIGMGSSGCAEVSRQIVRDWFDVGDMMGEDGKSNRPSVHDLQCVSPAYVQDAIPRRAGASGLKCYKVQGRGVCCDPQLQECATR
jgi:hypothetical protein